MPYVNCKRCSANFYAKPRHLKVGWGKFCSQKCQFQAQRTGVLVNCTECGQQIYRTPKHFKHSQSGNFFCNKSCFAVWKNKTMLIGEKHINWRHGEYAYRNIMKRTTKNPVCLGCGIKDFRVLLVHHKDRNRKNNKVENLVWLCHNCHHLEHREDRRNKMEVLV